MDTLVETVEGERIVEIHHDPHAESPRDCQDNFATLVCAHGRYDLPDELGFDFDACSSWKEVERELRRRGYLVVVPVFMLDHSGLALNTTGFGHCDPQGWDWGQVGFAACTPDDIRANWLLPPGLPLTPEQVEAARRLLVAEVDEYGLYLSGQVYGYVVRDPAGDEVESCWGFYGRDAALEAAREAA
jgi:hypothetical protein